MATPVHSHDSDEDCALVRKALEGHACSDLWTVEHIDITCDGCEQEPIVGARSPSPIRASPIMPDETLTLISLPFNAPRLGPQLRHI